MKKVYKLGIGVLLLLGIVFCVNMCQFARGVKEDTIKKKNQANTQDSIKISDSTYLHLKEVK
jgi:sulfite exporter TauE/SafE